MKRQLTVSIALSAALAGGATAVAVGPAQAAVRHTSVATAHVKTTTHAKATTTKAKASKAKATKAAQITAAIKRSPLLGDVPASDITVSKIRYASSNSNWASALVTPKDGRTDPAQVLVHRAKGSWSAKDLGTFGVGCGIVSSSVRSQLGLHGNC